MTCPHVVEQLPLTSCVFPDYQFSFSSVQPRILSPAHTSPNTYFSIFPSIICLQGRHVLPHLNRRGALFQLCKDLALCSCAAPVMQWERNVELQSIT